MNIPEVTVIIPVYNAEKYIRKSLNSILNQTLKNIEILVIEDCSTDNSLIIIQELQQSDDRVKIIKNSTNKGIVYGLNAGLDLASSDYIARMDADDIAYPERFEKQLHYLRQHTDTILVGTNMELIDDRENHISFREYPQHHAEIIAALFDRSPFGHPTVMFKKSAVIEIGGYREEFKTCEDYDLWLRLRNKGKFANLQETLLKYRVHNDQITFRKLKDQHVFHMKARHDALGLKDYSISQKLTGKSGTLGSKYLSIAFQQKELSNKNMATKMCATALLYSPLNSDAWKFLRHIIISTKTYDLIRYYATRALSSISKQ